MTREDFLARLTVNGELSPKRCTLAYLEKYGLKDSLDMLIDESFGTISERIKYVKYGGGYCKVCNVRTKVHVSGKGFGEYCKEHFHEPKKGKVAHNKKDLDIDLVKKLYFEDKKTILDISKILGDVSNVTIRKQLELLGVELRTHSENQKIKAKSGFTRPLIIIDRKELVDRYNSKVPMSELAIDYNCNEETIRRFLIQEGVQTFHRRSDIEYIIKEILDSLSIQYRMNDRKTIRPYEIDFIINEHNIGIELHGLFHHSYYKGTKDKNYHYNKYMMCKERGIKLFQFWEDIIRNKSSVIKSIIANACGISQNKVYARKCEVRDLDINEIIRFCDENHLQGAPASNAKGLGLFHDDVLISVLSYTIINDVVIITRFCSLLNYNVVGGFSKLCSKLKGTIKTYSSNDISDGNLYKATGFECLSESKHDLWYTDYKRIYNRQKFMKKNLKDIMPLYDENKTEMEIMFMNGYDAIFKSGTKTWVKVNT